MVAAVLGTRAFDYLISSSITNERIRIIIIVINGWKGRWTSNRNRSQNDVVVVSIFYLQFNHNPQIIFA
ncbi:hypothetical protein TorRG33x02_316230, partial [Trema orientale]